MSATVFVSSSNTNLELIATLYDVAPDGNGARITHGVVLGSQRELDAGKSWTDTTGVLARPWATQTHDSYLTPGEVYRVDIPLFPRQWGLQSGHQLRVELTTQTAPELAQAFVGTDPCHLTKPQGETLPGGTYTIVRGAETPAAVHLPQLPPKVFPTAASGVTPTSGGISEPLDWGS
jgi:predicted acyl esterase